MKTTYELLHRSNPNRGFTDLRGTFDSMIEAASAVANPQQWQPGGQRGYWWVHTGPSDQWLIAERQTPETDAERVQLALELIANYGQDDAAHHKAWTIDQAVRILTGNGYEQWIADYRDGEDGPETYSWDEGIAP